MGNRTESGLARGVWIMLIAAALGVAIIAGVRIRLSQVSDPETLSARLSSLLGATVQVDEVGGRLMMGRAEIEGVEIGSFLHIESAVLQFDPSSAMTGDLEIRSVSLSDPVWVAPGSMQEAGTFAKSLLLPFLLATRADVVTVEGGRVLDTNGGKAIATELRGVHEALSSGPQARRIKSNVSGELSRHGMISTALVWSVFGEGDSISVEEFALFARDLELRGGLELESKDPPAGRCSLYVDEFHGGSMRVEADLNSGPRGPKIEAVVRFEDCDAAGLMREEFNLAILTAGLLSGELRLRGDALEWLENGLEGLEVNGDLEIADGVLDRAGSVAGLLPLAPGGGEWVIEKASAQVTASRRGATSLNLHLVSGGMTWRMYGTVGRDGSLSGVIVGLVPAEMIGGGGTALSLLVALLGDREGRIPAAFSVGGSLEEPSVGFDLERTAEEAAAAGRPQAKQLVKRLSRSEIDGVNREVDAFIGNLKAD